MRPIALILGLAFALLVGCEKNSARWEGENGSELAKSLTEINRQLTQAYENEDIATLKEMLAEDHVHNNVFGSVMDKATFLGDIENGILEFESYETPEIRWQIHGDTAIATGLIDAEAVRVGKTVPARKFRFTRVFVRRGGDWKVLLFHNTMEGQAPR